MSKDKNEQGLTSDSPSTQLAPSGVIIIFQKSSDKCQINLMVDLTCQSATFGIYLRVLVYTIMYSGHTWHVTLPATEQCCFVSYTTIQVRTTVSTILPKCQTKQGNG